MREIKFRGKRKSGDEILIGDLNHIGGMVYIFQREQQAMLNSPDWYEVDPKTVGQYTGFIVNGIEVYEHDKFKFTLDDGEIEYGVVRFSEDGFWTTQSINHQEELLSDEINSSLKYELIPNINPLTP